METAHEVSVRVKGNYTMTGHSRIRYVSRRGNGCEGEVLSMDFGKRSAEVANVVCGVVVVYELGEKHGWWPMISQIDLGGYLLAICVIVAALLNFFALRRLSRSPEMAGRAVASKAQSPSWSASEQRMADQAFNDFRYLSFAQKIALVLLNRRALSAD